MISRFWASTATYQRALKHIEAVICQMPMHETHHPAASWVPPKGTSETNQQQDPICGKTNVPSPLDPSSGRPRENTQAPSAAHCAELHVPLVHQGAAVPLPLTAGVEDLAGGRASLPPGSASQRWWALVASVRSPGVRPQSPLCPCKQDAMLGPSSRSQRAPDTQSRR